MQLLCSRRRGESEAAASTINLGLPPPSPRPQTSAPHSQQPRGWEGQRGEKGVSRPLIGEGMKHAAQWQVERFRGCLPLPQALPQAAASQPRMLLPLSPGQLRPEPLTAYWNFSLYSRSLARARLSSSATERRCSQEGMARAWPTRSLRGASTEGAPCRLCHRMQCSGIRPSPE